MQVGRAGCSAALHQDVPVGVGVAGHQRHLVVVVGWVGSRWRWGQPEEASLLQMLMSHIGGAEPSGSGDDGERGAAVDRAEVVLHVGRHVGVRWAEG